MSSPKLINFGVLVWPILGEEHPRLDKGHLAAGGQIDRFWWVYQAKT